MIFRWRRTSCRRTPGLRLVHEIRSMPMAHLTGTGEAGLHGAGDGGRRRSRTARTIIGFLATELERVEITARRTAASAVARSPSDRAGEVVDRVDDRCPSLLPGPATPARTSRHTPPRAPALERRDASRAPASRLGQHALPATQRRMTSPTARTAYSFHGAMTPRDLRVPADPRLHDPRPPRRTRLRLLGSRRLAP